MDTLTERETSFIELWNLGRFSEVLDDIEDDELKNITHHVDLGAKMTIRIDDSPREICVANQLFEGQFEILLEADINDQLDVSVSNNKFLLEALEKRYLEMVERIVKHKKFHYRNPEEQTLLSYDSVMSRYIFKRVFDEKIFEKMYSLMVKLNRMHLVTDYFAAIRLRKHISEKTIEEHIMYGFRVFKDFQPSGST